MEGVEGNTRWGNTWLIPHIMMRCHHIVMRGISWVVDEMSIQKIVVSTDLESLFW
jgi:hypothetical protein